MYLQFIRVRECENSLRRKKEKKETKETKEKNKNFEVTPSNGSAVNYILVHPTHTIPDKSINCQKKKKLNAHVPPKFAPSKF